ncbi:MAG TPA: hypothetical protein VJV79_01540 [Polyangiaceae bacterium]|nr:hypothetical protein [Polyangiaceae bacterium]
MPRPEDTLDQLARLARNDEALHAASERRPTSPSSGEDLTPASVLPESLTQPISEAQQSSLVDAIQARLANAERSQRPAALVPFARRRRTALVALVAFTAAAAGVLLAVRGRPDPDGPLSRYEVRLEGSEQTERGSSQAPGLLRLRPSSELRFELRPSRDVPGSVGARAFLRGLTAGDTHQTRELEVTQEQSSAGALRVAAQVPTPLPERGELLLYVGRRNAIAHAPPSNGSSNATGPREAQEFRWQFERAP